VATKTLTITEAAYERLAAEKRPGESFTDVILRLTKKRSLFDLHKIVTKQEADSIAEAYLENRREQRELLDRKTGERDELFGAKRKER
jgi:predicted CopG family antitoxin